MKENDILEKYYLTKSQLLEIIEDIELPKPPLEVRILRVDNDKYLIYANNIYTDYFKCFFLLPLVYH